MDAKTLDTFEKLWLKKCKPLEELVFTLSISPNAEEYAPEAEAMVEKVKGMIAQYMQLLVDEFGIGDMNNLPTENTADEKARKREERRKRMEAFQRGEKP